MRPALALIAAAGLTLAWLGTTGPPKTRRTKQGRLLATIEASGIRALSPGRLTAISIGAFLATSIVVAASTGSTVVSLAIAIPAAWAPVTVVKARARRRRARNREAWPDVIAMLVSAVRSGISLPEAVGSLAHRGPKELSGAFASFSSTYRSSGRFADALDSIRDELADPIADRIAVSLEIAHEVGGPDLVRVLKALGTFVREDLKVRREIEARWSWTTSAARVAAAAPAIVLLMMASRPEASAAYSSSAGATVIGIAAALTLVGYRLMLLAARLPDDKRLSGTGRLGERPGWM